MTYFLPLEAAESLSAFLASAPELAVLPVALLVVVVLLLLLLLLLPPAPSAARPLLNTSRRVCGASECCAF